MKIVAGKPGKRTEPARFHEQRTRRLFQAPSRLPNPDVKAEVPGRCAPSDERKAPTSLRSDAAWLILRGVMETPQRVSISVVSHGQGSMVRQLLGDIRTWPHSQVELIVTVNIPEDESFLGAFASLPIKVIRNARPLGFGMNHNQALRDAQGDVFIVVNPDIRAPALDIRPLLETAADAGVGVCAPLVLSVFGRVEDSARRFPTVARLARRVLLRRRTSDYNITDGVADVDWVAGMFLVFRRDAFERVGGFDERYHMYMEDADICRRLSKLGLRVVVDPRCSVVHDAQRASHRQMRYLLWHLRSAVRFLLHL